MVKHV